MPMHAYEIPNLRFSSETAAAVTAKRFASINSNGLVEQAVAGEAVCGVIKTSATGAGQVVDINDGIVMVEAGGAVTAGTEVESDANGKAIPKTTGVRAGYAITGGAAGTIISVKI